MRHWCRLATALCITLAVTGVPFAASADNQTPTVSKVSLDAGALPYAVTLERVDTDGKLPTLQSFATATHKGLWILIGGRTNGLHDFTNDPLKNFPPSDQNRKIWVIDPQKWKVWSRRLSDSQLSQNQIDELSTTATESVQVGDTLYVIGGYGYSKKVEDFRTQAVMTAFDVKNLVDWVKRDTSKGLEKIIRQVRDNVLRVTGGQLAVIDGRFILAFGQNFKGGYGDPDSVKQVYTGQVRSFEVVDDGKALKVRDVKRSPSQPNRTDYRRRDYNMLPFMDTSGGKEKAALTAYSGVFTVTNGVYTVPVEIDAKGRPTMADPDASGTFKQAMNGYNAANLAIYDSKNGQSHALFFGGISYVTYNEKTGTFKEDASIPFTNDVTAIVRKPNGKYKQYFLTKFPRVKGPDVDKYRFGAEAAVFLDPDVPVTDNGMVDLRALKKKVGARKTRIGWIFGGIAAEKPNNGATVASNEVFSIVLDLK
jgi:hypothetical protein